MGVAKKAKTMLRRVGVALALVTLLGAREARADDCDDAFSSLQASALMLIDDAQAATVSGNGGLDYVWVVTGESFELAAKLHNADEDVTWKRMACASQSYTKDYDAVPSYNSTPPSGVTLAQVLALLANAESQVLEELGDLATSYPPCSTCLTVTEINAVLGPLSSFAEAVDDRHEELWPTGG